MPLDNSQNYSSHEVLSVPTERWGAAQAWECGLWVKDNAHNSFLKVGKKFAKAFLRDRSLFWKYLEHRDFFCGDDSNYWWERQFDMYAVIPQRISRAIEVGCGPYSNIRLISAHRKIDQIVCADPLIRTYTNFPHTWISHASRRNRIVPSECPLESLDFPDASFDLAVCINVLDHVQDATRCLRELIRVTRPGGQIVLGQELTNEDDLQYPENRDDIGHPIKILSETLDAVFDQTARPLIKKILPRQECRLPKYHYGTYIFVGQRI